MTVTIEERIEQIKPLAKQGLPPREIADQIGLSWTHVYRIMRVGRDHGVLPDTRKHDVMRSITIGRLGRELKGQPPGFTRWLADAIPEDATLAEFAVACLVDLYFEDMDRDD